jgi:hypothetical protein
MSLQNELLNLASRVGVIEHERDRLFSHLAHANQVMQLQDAEVAELKAQLASAQAISTGLLSQVS